MLFPLAVANLFLWLYCCHFFLGKTSFSCDSSNCPSRSLRRYGDHCRRPDDPFIPSSCRTQLLTALSGDSNEMLFVALSRRVLR